MESILPAFVVIFLLLFATLAPAQSYLASQDRIQASRQAMEARLLDRARTDLALVSTHISLDGTVVELTIRNMGQTKLADFDQWDMNLEYYGSGYAYHIAWLPYAEGAPAALNTWGVASISQDVFDPDILNPGETITVQFQVSPAVGPETINRVALTTPSGIGVSSVFIGPPLPPTPTPPAP